MTMIEVELLDGACCLQSLDDPVMQRAAGIERVQATKHGIVFRMSIERALALLDAFGSNFGAGWAHENPGAAKRAAQGAQRRIRAALAAAEGK